MSACPQPAFSDRVSSVFILGAAVFRPPAKVTVSEWAERERILSTESSAEVGRYRVARAPYQRAMMDAVNIPGVEQLVYFTGAQLGKSLCEENIFGYFASEDPGPVLWMWPTKEVAKDWSADTLEAFLRDTPALSAKFTAAARKASNRGQFKKFPGGWLAVIGANSPADLRRRRARIVIGDEIDGYPHSAGDEGDPLSLVLQRSVTFWNRLEILASTCTNKGESRIEAAYDYTNKQRFWVPCPHCGEFQLLRWSGVITPRNEEPTVENTIYVCGGKVEGAGCGVELTEFDKQRLLDGGQWRAERPEITKRQGFWINSLYSPFESWASLMQKFRKAMNVKAENPELLKTFINLSLAETWEEKDERPDREGLVRRCEDYGPLLPDGVTVLTAAADVQPDRIELEVVGWGKGKESWSIERKLFEGETSQPDVWTKLDAYLETEFVHVRGPRLPIAATFIDSGFHTNDVYNFTKPRAYRRIYASKGSSNFFHVPLAKKKKIDRANVWLFNVGVGAIKKTIYQWLRLETPGPGYMHFSTSVNDPEFFDQLTAETLKKKNEHGFPKPYWEKRPGARNEALDIRVYNYAALLSLSEQPDKMLDYLRAQLVEEARKLNEQRKHGNPNQLSLLDPPEVEEAPVPEAVAEKIMVIAEGMRAVSVAIAAVKAPESSPRPPAPRITIRRSSWI
jgi:phage terminase large subunit GpA-like protein